MESTLYKISEWEYTNDPDIVLDLSNLQLTNLPGDIPNSVRKLNCSNNLLTELPGNLQSLNELYCFNNRLTKLPENLLNVIDIVCNDNLLENVPINTPLLKNFIAKNNRITELSTEFLNLKLERVELFNNLISPELCDRYKIINNTLENICTNTSNQTEYFMEQNKILSETLLDIPIIIDYQSILQINHHEYDKYVEKSLIINSTLETIHNYHVDIEKKYSGDFKKKIKESCSNETDYIMNETIDAKHGITVIFSLKDNYSECYLPEQLNDTFKIYESNNMNDEDDDDEGRKQVYEYDTEIKKRLDNRPVFKLPYRGVWIDYRSYILLKLFNCFVLREVGLKSLYSEYGMSRIHGSSEMVYTLDPYPIDIWIETKNTKFLKKEEILNNVKNFFPTKNDISSEFISLKDITIAFSTLEKTCIGNNINYFIQNNNEDLIAIYSNFSSPPTNNVVRISVKTGELYLGEINSKSQKHGRGILHISNNNSGGELLIGSWNKNICSGQFEIYSQKNKLYIGNIDNGMCSGLGMYFRKHLSNSNYVKYYGLWINNYSNGKGLYITNNNIYSGIFEPNFIIKDGKIRYENGDLYSGNINSNYQKDYYGTYKSLHYGYSIVGSISNDSFNGIAVLKDKNNTLFLGSFENNNFMDGKIKYENKDTYEGKSDKYGKYGHGIFVSHIGYTYVGEWYKDKMHGVGILSLPNNNSCSGVWENGNLIYEKSI